MKRSSIFIFISFIILFHCRENIEKSENLIINTGFEHSIDSNPEGWIIKKAEDTRTFHWEISNQSHSGAHSIMFGRVWSEAWEMNGFKTENPIPLDPMNKYLVTFWYKTENIEEYPIPLVIRLNVYRDSHDPLRYQKFISNSSKWKQIKWLIDTLPQDAVSADVEFFIWIRTQGSAFVDDVTLKVAGQSDREDFYTWRRLPVPDITQEPEQDPYPPTGFYAIKQSGERWWLVDPEGKPTWAIATMGEIPGGRGNGNIHLAEWFKKEYQGDRMKYAEMQYNLLESWAINSFAGWTVEEFAQITENRYHEGKNWSPMYQVLNFSIMGADKDYYARNSQGEFKGVHDHSFPDPFNPSWRKDAREKASEMITRFKGKPWFVGWFMDNEIDYSSLFEYVWGEYSSIEFIHYLESRYGNIDQLNESWSSSFNPYHFSSFKNILLNKPSPVEWEDPLYADFIAFERIMIQEYIDYTYNMVKEMDPDHLIISNRLNLDPMMSLYRTLDLWSKYDVVCVNIYPENLYFGFSSGELEILENIHQKTGRPILIGEWSIPAMDSDLYELGDDPLNRPLDWSWPQVVKDQKERGRIYETCMKQLASRPYMLGAAWFKVFDVDSRTRRANRGLIDGNHQPYTEFMEYFVRTNREIKRKLNIAW